MNLKQLSAFREVMLTGSASEAARNLYRTQPAISAAIAGLEDDIGFKLFERRGSRLHPLPEAHYLLEEASAIIERLKSAERTMKSIRELEEGKVHVLSMPGPSVFLMPELISRFVSGKDHVKVSMITRSSVQIQQLISAQQYDVGLADLGPIGDIESRLVNHERMTFECVCALRADDPLATKERISAKDLDGKPMASLNSDHPFSQQLQDAFDQSGAQLNIRFEAQFFVPLFSYVLNGLAYAVIDPLSTHSFVANSTSYPNIVFRPFSPAVHLFTSIVTPARRPLSNLASAFVDELRRELISISDAEG